MRNEIGIFPIPSVDPCFKACVILSNVADETIIAEFIEKNSDAERDL